MNGVNNKIAWQGVIEVIRLCFGWV